METYQGIHRNIKFAEIFTEFLLKQQSLESNFGWTLIEFLTERERSLTKCRWSFNRNVAKPFTVKSRIDVKKTDIINGVRFEWLMPVHTF